MFVIFDNTENYSIDVFETIAYVVKVSLLHIQALFFNVSFELRDF